MPETAEIQAVLHDILAAGGRAQEVIQRNRELFTFQTVQHARLDIHTVITEPRRMPRRASRPAA
jgi:hypothetical protein